MTLKTRQTEKTMTLYPFPLIANVIPSAFGQSEVCCSLMSPDKFLPSLHFMSLNWIDRWERIFKEVCSVGCLKWKCFGWEYCLQMLDVPTMNDILFIVLKRLFYASYHDKASYRATSALLKRYILTYYFTEQCEGFFKTWLQ